ncbi:MAG: DUF2007 domain-containing protein [Bacteroidales bacterium]|nr:DUF2007 domain-containing protein [Bacteroidales bacterium]
MEKGWVMLTYFDHRNRADMFSALLESINIQAVAINKKGSELLVGSVEIYVKEEDYDKAKECLNDFEN